MDYPTLDQVRQLRDAEMATRADNRRPLLPLCCDILADMETPVSAYCKTAKGPYSFLLESVTGGERIARYSFIGIDPYLVMKHCGETVTLHRIGLTPSNSFKPNWSSTAWSHPLASLMINCRVSMVVQLATWLMRRLRDSSIYLFHKKMNSDYLRQSFASPRRYWSLIISNIVSGLSLTCTSMLPTWMQNTSMCWPSSRMCNNAFDSHRIYQKNQSLYTMQPHC